MLTSRMTKSKQKELEVVHIQTDKGFTSFTPLYWHVEQSFCFYRPTLSLHLPAPLCSLIIEYSELTRIEEEWAHREQWLTRLGPPEFRAFLCGRE